MTFGYFIKTKNSIILLHFPFVIAIHFLKDLKIALQRLLFNDRKNVFIAKVSEKKNIFYLFF